MPSSCCARCRSGSRPASDCTRCPSSPRSSSAARCGSSSRSRPASGSTSRSRSARRPTSCVRRSRRSSEVPAGVRASRLVRRGGLLRCPGAVRAADRSRVQRDPAPRPRGPRLSRLGRKEEQVEVKLIVQPDDGIAPLLQAIRGAKKTIDIVIFRFDRAELEKALKAAVAARGRGAGADRAHQSRRREDPAQARDPAARGRDHGRRARADDLVRYHGKMMVVDDRLHVYRLQLHQARHRQEPQLRHRHQGARLVQEALKLFEADRTRQAYTARRDHLVVSPENSRAIADRLHRKAQEGAAHLRHQGQRHVDACAAGRSAPGRASACASSGSSAKAASASRRASSEHAAARPRHHPRRPAGVRRQPEPAEARARRRGVRSACSWRTRASRSACARCSTSTGPCVRGQGAGRARRGRRQGQG